jgi:hypothetical protein
MSKTPSISDVRQLLSAICALRDIGKIAYAAEHSPEFEKVLAALVADAEQALLNCDAMDALVVRNAYPLYRSRLADIIRQAMSKVELAENSLLSNAELCEFEHRRIVAGRCPWCGRYVISGMAENVVWD